MMSVKPGGVETIGSCLRLKVPDPSTSDPATDSLPCYLVTATLLPATLLCLAPNSLCCHYSHSSHVHCPGFFPMPGFAFTSKAIELGFGIRPKKRNQVLQYRLRTITSISGCGRLMMKTMRHHITSHEADKNKL